MLRREFVVDRHEEFGNVGFKPKWMPNGDPLDGMGLAHDILEHFPRDDGSLEHELLALGAGLWIRGEGGYWDAKGNSNPPEAHIASDLSSMHWPKEPHIVEPPRRRFDPAVMELCTLAVTRSVADLKGNGCEWSPSGEQQRRAAGWLAAGYARAQRRYRGSNAYSLSYLFQRIEDRANQLLRGADEGMKLVVSCNLRRLDFTMSIDYEHE